MENEETETYTTKDFAKDVVGDVVKGVASTAIAYTTLLAIGFTVTKVNEFRENRKAKNNLTEK